MRYAQQLVALFNGEDAVNSNGSISVCNIVIRTEMTSKKRENREKLRFG